MTDMQGKLFPPLDEESGTDAQDEVLPQELQDRFAKVRSLMREKVVGSNNHSNDDDDANADTSATAEADLKRKQREAALDAAKGVHDEVARLQNGIAELEALYATQQRRQNNIPSEDEEDESSESDVDDEDDGVILGAGNHHNNHAPAAVVFPALSSFVNAVEPDVEAEETVSSKTRRSEGQQSHHKPGNDPVVTAESIYCKS